MSYGDDMHGLGQDGLSDEERAEGIAPFFGPPEIVDTGARVDRIAEAGAIVLDEDPDGPQVEADPTPVRPGREPAPELDDGFKASPLLYPNGTYATIKVRYGDAYEWPVVERAKGAWQSGAHRYYDDVVEAVRVLPVNGQVVLTEEMVEIAVAGIVGSSWKFRGPDARKATLEDGYTALQAMLAAEPVTVPRKDPDALGWSDLFGIAPDMTAAQLFGDDHPEAAPRPVVDRDALVKVIDAAGSLEVGGTRWPLDRENVQEIADAVLKAIPLVPTREAVAKAIEDAAVHVDLAKYFLPGTMDAFVDAVLSLFAGADNG